jgi:hypothetical protein
MHSRHLEKSLVSKGRAAHSTPLDKVYYGSQADYPVKAAIQKHQAILSNASSETACP